MKGEDIPTLSSELPITIVIYRNSPSSVYVMNTQDVTDSLYEWIQGEVKTDLKRIMRVSMDAPFYLHLRSVDDVDGAEALLAVCLDVIKVLFPGWKLDVRLRVSAGEKHWQYPRRLVVRDGVSFYEPEEV